MNITNYIGQFSLKYLIENFNNIVLPYQLWKFLNPNTQKYTYLYLGKNPKRIRVGHYIKSIMFTDLEDRDIEKIVRIIDSNTAYSYIPDSWLNSDNLVYLVESDFRKNLNENSALRFLNVLKHDWRNESYENLE
jgi:hypothetical protein